MALPVMQEFEIDRSRYDDANEEDNEFEAPPGVNEEVVRLISEHKDEPDWMLQKRLKALKLYEQTGFPNWGPDLTPLIKDMDNIRYFVKPKAKESKSWDDLPEDIRRTYERIGIPEAEKKSLSGAGAQYDSEIVYHNLKKEWEDKGVIFTNMDVAVKKYPELVKKYFMTSCIPINDHKFIMLHAAVWSGGTFIYVPKDVKVKIPLQAYFRMNAEYGGQFEHTLIIADEGAEVHYIEGCFTEGNLVSTNPDYVAIEDVKEGDKVLTSEGDYKRVKDLQRQPYSGKLYTIELYGDSTQRIEVTEEHPFLYADRKRKNERNDEFEPRWNIPKFFKRGDYLAIPINQEVVEKDTYTFTVSRGEGRGVRESLWEQYDVDVPATKEFFRLVGYYLAEGSVSGGHYLNFSFHEDEREHIEDVKSCLRDVFGDVSINETHHEANHGTNVVVSSTELVRVFSHFGRGAHRKHVTSEFMYAPHELQKELVKGWFRGDGNYYNKKHENGRKELFRINTVSEKLARQGRDILLRLGVVAFLNRRDRSKTGRKDMYTLGITGGQMPRFGRLVGIPIPEKLHGKRRASRFGLTEKFAFLPIKSIATREVEDHPVYNFAVEDRQTYAVGGAAVHNCSAPQFNSSSLHAGCVELHALKGSRIRYSSVENWSRNTYNLNTKRALVHEDAVVEWINGNLGCLTGDSEIYTNPKGPVKIKNIEAGDTIYAWDEETNTIKRAKVKAKIFSGEKEVFNVEAGGRSIRASANHPFLTLEHRKNHPDHKKGFFHPVWKPLEELEEGDVVAIAKRLPLEGEPYRIPEIRLNKQTESNNQYDTFTMRTDHLYNDITIPDETTEDLMWFLGLLLGDGFVDAKQNKIVIATHETEDYRDDLCTVIKELFDYDVVQKYERSITINSKLLCKLFSRLGITGTADTKIVPEWVFRLPEDQILSFLAGYFDADGHPHTNSLALTSVNKRLLESVKALAISVGFGVSRIMQHSSAGKRVICGVECNAKDSWRLLLNGKSVYDLPIRCRKKKEKVKELRTRRNYSTAKGKNFTSKTNENVGYARIDRIASLGIKPTWDIEVEKYHNFVSNGMIVHNSGVTMLYPCSVLVGERARSDSLGIAFAGEGQNQDTGSKVIHAAPNTSSTIQAKSISKDGGISTYRGLVKVTPRAKNSKVSVECDALLIGDESTSNTYPMMKIDNNHVEIAHEATVGKIGTDEIFYLMSRGLSEEQARQMVVAGFIEPIVKQLPMEYSVELNKLIELEMEGSVG